MHRLVNLRAALIKFNARILKEVGLKGEKFQLRGVEGVFLRNPSVTA